MKRFVNSNKLIRAIRVIRGKISLTQQLPLFYGFKR